MIWVAVYASKRRSENQRLEQEYAHKEALARSYISYKKQISELGKEDNVLLEKLILEAINAISYNASKTLDKKARRRHNIKRNNAILLKFKSK